MELASGAHSTIFAGTLLVTALLSLQSGDGDSVLDEVYRAVKVKQHNSLNQQDPFFAEALAFRRVISSFRSSELKFRAADPQTSPNRLILKMWRNHQPGS
jgi:hypothetical protein